MVQVATYEEVKSLEDRLEKAEAQIAFLTTLLLSQKWLNRAQTIQALNVSEKTLWRLTRDGRLTHRYEGKKPLYCVDGLRDYMNSKKIEATTIDHRLLATLNS